MNGNVRVVTAVKSELGPRASITLRPSEHRRVLDDAESILPRMTEATMLNTPWDDQTRARQRAIRLQLRAEAHQSGDLEPTE